MCTLCAIILQSRFNLASIFLGMRGICDRSVESCVSLLRRLDHLSKGDLGDLGLVADELESSGNLELAKLFICV